MMPPVNPGSLNAAVGTAILAGVGAALCQARSGEAAYPPPPKRFEAGSQRSSTQRVCDCHDS